MVTALWSSIGDDDNPLDQNYGVEDFAECTVASIRALCCQFLCQNLELIERAVILGHDGSEQDRYERAGHDLWLTTCGSGAGFWDGDWRDQEEPNECCGGRVGELLTASAKQYKGPALYAGDDGKIYSWGLEMKEQTCPKK